MLIVEAVIILGVLTALVILMTTVLRSRARRLELKEAREFQIKQLVAARELVCLMMLDEDNAVKLFQQLEKDLTAKGKLPKQLNP